MNLWQVSKAEDQITPLAGLLYRLVEGQEHAATLSLVDTLEEQVLLEDLLEQVKPPEASAYNHYHYLLRTPFRYPPLPWGSRFGRQHEPSLFYGGLSVMAVLAECAYYRFVFWQSMQGRPPKPMLRSEHTLFSAEYQCERGLQLQSQAFIAFRDMICNKSNYLAAQQLGSDMRSNNITAFEYPSARSVQPTTCIGLFSPAAFKQPKPLAMWHWVSEVGAETAAFKATEESQVTCFRRADFCLDGTLPIPA
ncbi:RES family NAD+ phosphorylase [Alteromonas flava]|uniref:RES family NAD+ phosphorylase n=1 Tax=Alteromonas flava TaxID=2048003 RepID=UPI000C28EC74|nr:RES family NAD+ phosphorylase [Alteromonas flava]